MQLPGEATEQELSQQGLSLSPVPTAGRPTFFITPANWTSGDRGRLSQTAAKVRAPELHLLRSALRPCLSAPGQLASPSRPSCWQSRDSKSMESLERDPSPSPLGLLPKHSPYLVQRGQVALAGPCFSLGSLSPRSPCRKERQAVKVRVNPRGRSRGSSGRRGWFSVTSGIKELTT